MTGVGEIRQKLNQNKAWMQQTCNRSFRHFVFDLDPDSSNFSRPGSQQRARATRSSFFFPVEPVYRRSPSQKRFFLREWGRLYTGYVWHSPFQINHLVVFSVPFSPSLLHHLLVGLNPGYQPNKYVNFTLDISAITWWIILFSKIQLVVDYQCCVLIGWATTRLYAIAH